VEDLRQVVRGDPKLGRDLPRQDALAVTLGHEMSEGAEGVLRCLGDHGSSLIPE
jgi:hypothetical protein